MGNITSREMLMSYDRRIQDLEQRVLELEQRIFLGATKDEHGVLVFEKDFEKKHYNSRSSSVDTEVNNVYAQLKSSGTNTTLY